MALKIIAEYSPILTAIFPACPLSKSPCARAVRCCFRIVASGLATPGQGSFTQREPPFVPEGTGPSKPRGKTLMDNQDLRADLSQFAQSCPHGSHHQPVESLCAHSHSASELELPCSISKNGRCSLRTSSVVAVVDVAFACRGFNTCDSNPLGPIEGLAMSIAPRGGRSGASDCGICSQHAIHDKLEDTMLPLIMTSP